MEAIDSSPADLLPIRLAKFSTWRYVVAMRPPKLRLVGGTGGGKGRVFVRRGGGETELVEEAMRMFCGRVVVEIDRRLRGK